MPGKSAYPAIPLPRNWPSRIKSDILHVINLTQFAVAYTRGWAANSLNTRVRLKGELSRVLEDNALLREEMRIKDLRMTRILPHRRPLYPPTERMAILQIKAARQWSLEQTAHAFLGRVMHAAKAKPKHLIMDKGPQFWNADFKTWCRVKKKIKPRFGAIGQHGSLAVIERLILTLKQCIAWLPLVPLRRNRFRQELLVMADWYNTARPHMSLGGRTPDEVYYARFPANRQPRFEPGSSWPRGSPCARPWALVRSKPGVQIELDVELQAGRRHLPVVRLRRAA